MDNVIALTGAMYPVSPAYSGFDAFLNTSEMETFGNSVCEAMLAGLPVVGYGGGSIAEVVGGHGMLCDVGDEDAAYGYLVQLITSVGLASRIGSQGRLHIETNYSVEQSYEKFLAMVSSFKR